MTLFSVGRAALAVALAAAAVQADPLSHRQEIDFYRDAASRDLAGFATRADGRLVAGPSLTELTGFAPAELLWTLEPAGNGKWWVGTGPDGRIFEVSIDAAAHRYSSREIVKLPDSQVFAVCRLANGDLLAGTSPKAGLYLVRAGKVIKQTRLPADSVFDLKVEDAGTVLAATGNPGVVYAINTTTLAFRQVTKIGDRNIRRLARLSDGRWAAGSAPAGNVYVFSLSGGPPEVREENHEAEVTDLLPDRDGGFEAAVVFGGAEGRERVVRDTPNAGSANPPSGPAPTVLQPERFAGRSVLVRFGANGFPEILGARISEAMYALARHGSVILAAGGEQGQLTGYDTATQTGLNFAGSASARLTAIQRDGGSEDHFVVLHNNAAGFALLDFNPAGARSAVTRAMDLGQQAQVGAVRLDRMRGVESNQVNVEIKVSNASGDREGWGPWTPLVSHGDGWRLESGTPLRGRYYRLRVKVPAGSAEVAELGRAAIFFLPQNRRPQLQDFHLLSPNFGLVLPSEAPPQIVTTLGQLTQAHGEDDREKRKDRLMGAQVVPMPGNEVAFWTVTAPSGDNVVCTFSLRRDHAGRPDGDWMDVAVDTRDGFASFDISHLPEGIYSTRLTAREVAPRAAADRLTAVFTTEDLVVDHTPPDILSAEAHREGSLMIVKVHGRDALSLLDSIEADFNTGQKESVEQPADGVRDGREETFVLEVPVAKIAGATSVQVTLYDAAGNGATRTIALQGLK